MELQLVLIAIFFFAGSLTRSLASGTDDTSSQHSNKTLPLSTSTTEKLTVFRNESVELGTTVTLKCSDTKILRHDLIFVIWKIQLRDRECIIAMATNDSDHDTCEDGKKQQDTEAGTYHLIIPNFSVRDEGNYTCDISYSSGGFLEIITVSGFAHPQLSGWLENKQGQTFAVCEATSKPATTIHWKTDWNSSSPITQTHETTEQLFTVTSRLLLPHKASHRNLTCLATSNDLKHSKAQLSTFTFTDVPIRWPYIFGGVFATCCTVALLTGLYIMRKSLIPLSVFRKICSKPDITASNEEKPQQSYDPEELEPYASYVQRVNSIYNSSAELKQ